jgi:predicted RNA methylase
MHTGRTAEAITEPDFRALGRALGRGQLVVDRVFDAIYPVEIQRLSAIHWTPVEVALRVVRMLRLAPNEVLLDVGAGVGKFCIVASAAQPSVKIRGIEHRARLVEIAKEGAAKVGVEVDLRTASFEAVDAAEVDAVYLFNPFAENISDPEDWLDASVELGETRYRRDVALVQHFLSSSKIGTRVVTYCGFGGAVPAEFDLLRRERCAGTLELWVKARRHSVQVAS